MNNSLKDYEHYLKTIGSIVEKFFEQQKPFIFCKEGCSICCESGNYPFSKLEFDYAIIGFKKLPENTQKKILAKVKMIKTVKEQSAETNFFHACPFLINKKCSIYAYRGLICRSYGLITHYTDREKDLKCNFPCCVLNGLNYANVYDKNLKKISTELWKKSGIETEPIAFNVDVDFLLNNSETQKLKLDFGQQKCLVDWFD